MACHAVVEPQRDVLRGRLRSQKFEQILAVPAAAAEILGAPAAAAPTTGRFGQFQGVLWRKIQEAYSILKQDLHPPRHCSSQESVCLLSAASRTRLSLRGRDHRIF